MIKSVYKERATGAVICTSNPENYSGDDYEFLGSAEEPTDDQRWCEKTLCFKDCSHLKQARAARPKSSEQKVIDLEARVLKLEALVDKLSKNP